MLNEVGLFDENLSSADDWDMRLRIGRRFLLGFINRPGAFYRHRPGSISDRGAQLIANRIRVLAKQPASTSTDGVRRSLNDMLAINYASLAWECRKQGDGRGALQNYCASLRRRRNWFALNGLVLTMIHASNGGMRALMASRNHP